MIASVLLPLTLAQAAPPPLAWRVVTPLDAADVALLDDWWSKHEQELGASAQFDRAVVLGLEALTPDTLLLGFERGALIEAERDGALGSAVLPLASESWGPVRAAGGEGETPDFDSWDALL